MWRFITLSLAPPLAFILSFRAHMWCFIIYWSVLVCGVLSHIGLCLSVAFYHGLPSCLYVAFCHMFSYAPMWCFITYGSALAYAVLPHICLFCLYVMFRHMGTLFFMWCFVAYLPFAYVMFYHISSPTYACFFVLFCSVLICDVLSRSCAFMWCFITYVFFLRLSHG